MKKYVENMQNFTNHFIQMTHKKVFNPIQLFVLVSEQINSKTLLPVLVVYPVGYKKNLIRRLGRIFREIIKNTEENGCSVISS